MKEAKKTFDFGSRLRSCIDANNLKYGEFADKSGVKANALSNYLNNVSRPNYEIIAAFVKILGVTADYLLGITDDASGKAGPQYFSQPDDQYASGVAEEPPGYGPTREAAKARSGAGTLPGEVIVTVNQAGQPAIAMVGGAALAEYPGQYLNREFYQKLPQLAFPSPELTPGSYRCFQVKGESMATTLQPGDWVIARHVAREQAGKHAAFALRMAQVYVVVTREAVLIKRLASQPGSRSWVLVSDNEDYRPVEVASADVLELWEVSTRISSHLSSPSAGVLRQVGALEADYKSLLDRLQALESKVKKG